MTDMISAYNFIERAIKSSTNEFHFNCVDRIIFLFTVAYPDDRESSKQLRLLAHNRKRQILSQLPESLKLQVT
jgi:hypothetical protein